MEIILAVGLLKSFLRYVRKVGNPQLVLRQRPKSDFNLNVTTRLGVLPKQVNSIDFHGAFANGGQSR